MSESLGVGVRESVCVCLCVYVCVLACCIFYDSYVKSTDNGVGIECINKSVFIFDWYLR